MSSSIKLINFMLSTISVHKNMNIIFSLSRLVMLTKKESCHKLSLILVSEKGLKHSQK